MKKFTIQLSYRDIEILLITLENDMHTRESDKYYKEFKPEAYTVFNNEQKALHLTFKKLKKHALGK